MYFVKIYLGGACWLYSYRGDINAEFNNCYFRQNSVDEVMANYGLFTNKVIATKCTFEKYGSSSGQQIVTTRCKGQNAKMDVLLKKCEIKAQNESNLVTPIFSTNEVSETQLNASSMTILEECNIDVPKCDSVFGGSTAGTYYDIQDYKDKLMIYLYKCTVKTETGKLHVSGYPVNIYAEETIFTTNNTEFDIYDATTVYPYEEIFKKCVFKRVNNMDSTFLIYSTLYGLIQRFYECVFDKFNVYNNEKTATQLFNNSYIIENIDYALSNEPQVLLCRRIPKDARKSVQDVTITTSSGTIGNNTSFYDIKNRLMYLNFMINTGSKTSSALSITISPAPSTRYGSISCMAMQDDGTYQPIGSQITGSSFTIYPKNNQVIRVCGILPY